MSDTPDDLTRAVANAMVKCECVPFMTTNELLALATIAIEAVREHDRIESCGERW